MTLVELPLTKPLVAATHGRWLRVISNDRRIDLDPHWLRDRSIEAGQIDETSRQRLFTPGDIDADLAVVACTVESGAIVVEFSDGHVATLPLAPLLRDLGWIDDPERPPLAVPWTQPLAQFPYVDWAGIGWSDADADPDAVLDFLAAFYRHGYVVFRNTPTDEGTVARIANRIGYISGNNFGWVFDVRAEQRPTDLAYTSIELLAHTDEPYRIEPPGIQLLHCIANEAPGGDSTLVDGLAAAHAIAAERPDLHAALRDVDVEFRYDMGIDTVVNRGRILEYDRNGVYAAIRFNTKIDAPVVVPSVDLAPWYEGRRWLARWLNDPAHQVTFRLDPGDVMFMDNHRALHGRTAFDPSRGRRHLQGCYIEHNGPDTMYRLAVRRRAKLTA